MPLPPADSRPFIPILPDRSAERAASADGHACSGAESFALMVLGDSMAPEFADGDIVIIEPEGLATDRSYVLAFWQGEWIFRQLVRSDDRWRLRALNPQYPDIDLPDLGAVRGVITQKCRPGRRRASKRYVE
ncbi:MAG: S24 family peptidase [Burkholderiaceae bacterium]